MYIEVSSEDLKAALGLVSKANGKKGETFTCQCINIKAEAGFVELSATNGHVYATSKVRAHTAQEGEINVLGTILTNAVSKLDGSIVLQRDRQQLQLSSGRSKYKLAIHEDAFPTVPEMGQTLATFKGFASIVQQTSFVADDSIESKPEFGGVYFDGENAVATNGSCLVMTPVRTSGTFFIPKTSLVLASKLGDDVEAVDCGGSWVAFKAPIGTIYTTQINSTFPNYKSLIVADQPIRLHIERAELLQAIDQASVVSSDLDAVVLETIDGEATLKRGSGTDNYESVLRPTAIEGEGTARFSASVLRGFLKSAHDEIDFGYNADSRQAFIQSSGHSLIIMPIREG